MSSMMIRFTEKPVLHTTSTVQSIYQAIDLGGHYRVLDTILAVYTLTGTAEATLRVETSMEATDDDQWVTIHAFPKVSFVNTFVLGNMSGALRYVRYGLTLSGAGSVVFDISGYARTEL